ncbi:MAG: cupredoxin domain-containing protein [Acidimicrobiia bacterium]
MSRRPPTLVLVLAVPVVALIAGLTTRAVEGPSSATVAKAGAHTIVIKNFAFHPQRLTVPKGTLVEVTNRDAATHTLSARNGSFDTGNLDGGKTATIALNRSGIFSYHCQIHGNMTGTLVVK